MVHPAASPFFVASSVSPRLRGDWSSLARGQRLEDETNGELPAAQSGRGLSFFLPRRAGYQRFRARPILVIDQANRNAFRINA